jgi:uncharacterized protein YkwD
MLFRHIACLLALAVTAVAGSIAQAADPQVVLSTDEAELLKLINAERAKVGAGPLEPQAQLVLASRDHAAGMLRLGYTEHTIDGKDPGKRLAAQGLTWWTDLREIATHDKTPQDAMKSWMNSPNHKGHILNPNAAKIGIGRSAAELQGAPFWSCVFVGAKDFEGGRGSVTFPAGPAPAEPKTPAVAPIWAPMEFFVGVTNNTRVVLKMYKVKESGQRELLATLQSQDHSTVSLPQGTRVDVYRTDTRTRVKSLVIGDQNQNVEVQF